MLEILILIRLAKRIGAIVASKGRKKGGYQFLLVVLWFAGEFLGGVFGAALAFFTGKNDDSGVLLSYLFALIGAILGAFVAFRIAKSLTPLDDEQPYLEDIARAEALGARDHFGDHNPTPSAMDGYTDQAEKAPRPPDERIQG